MRELGLPSGCIIVRCVEGGREWVPTAVTRLEPFVLLTVVISPEASGAVELLRHGCEAGNGE